LIIVLERYAIYSLAISSIFEKIGIMQLQSDNLWVEIVAQPAASIRFDRKKLCCPND
jgi:hypothetical protein